MLKNKVTGITITEKEYFRNLLDSLKDNWEELIADRFDSEADDEDKLTLIKEWAENDDCYEYEGTEDTNTDYDVAYNEYITNATKELIE